MVSRGATQGEASMQDGSISIVNELLRVPGLRVVNILGRGANAVVFEAVDEFLDRRVAVKIWNARGAKRARHEAAKIANLNHPLIVATYQFGWTKGRPYSVMELVRGVSGKDWLKQDQSPEARALVWRRYSESLRFIHSTGGVHGDPHLGNLLIHSDDNEVLGRARFRDAARLSAKLADAGTSHFWSSREDFQGRERALILETAARLFNNENFDRLWVHPDSFSHEDTLQALDALSDYVLLLSGAAGDDNHAAVIARALGDVVTRTPLFDLDEVAAQIRRMGDTVTRRFSRGLNSRFIWERESRSSSNVVDPETKRQYEKSRQTFVERISRQANSERSVS
jgi:serine/threonine protein kinase